MFKYLISATIIICYISCNKGLDAKIETREKDKVYLVNTSKTKPFKFTVKATIITNDSVFDYRTDVIELPPGDEKFLGEKKEIIIVPKPKFDPTKPYEVLPDDFKIDTFKQPIIQNTVEYRYEVTGQIEIKSKK